MTNFTSIDSLQPVVKVLNEAADALNDKNRSLKNSPISEVLVGVTGAGVGGIGSLTALYALGTTGLSAVGITSGLATAGAVIGGGMVAGIFVLATPVAFLAAVGVGVTTAVKKNRLKNEKEILYTEALKKHNAIIRALKEEANADSERLNYLQGLNTLLQRAINDLLQDIKQTA